LFILTVYTNSITAQVIQKKELQPSEYHLWEEIELDLISPDEKWASYHIIHENTGDTLLVRNILDRKTYAFAGGSNSLFTGSHHFVCLTEDGLSILDLKTGKTQTIPGVKKYDYCESTDQLVFLVSESKKSTLVIRAATGESKRIGSVTDFSISDKARQLAYVTSLDDQRKVSLINLEKLNATKDLMTDSTANFIRLTWQENGRSLVFLKQGADKTINFLFQYVLASGKLYTFDPKEHTNFPTNSLIYADTFGRIFISDDSQKVFFCTLSKPDPNKSRQKSVVEIWNANDKRTFKADPNRGSFETKAKVNLWQPQSNRFTPITSAELPEVMLAGNFDFAVLSNPLDYEPQFTQEGPRDYYMMNLKTFEKHLFLKKQSEHYYACLSPTGKYFTYFKENNWWVYNILAKTHTNITMATGGKFKAKIIELEPESVAGNPGWSTNDKEIILYDQYDLWAITPDGKSFRRLTRGRESGIRYKMPALLHKGRKTIYDVTSLNVYDLNKTLLLRARGDDGKTGYYTWNNTSGEKPLFYANSYTDQLLYNINGNNIIFRESRFNLSPTLLSVDKSGKPHSFFESNPQQEKYFWGRSELFEFKNKKGQNIKGTLIYPANYDPKKKYPMVVNTYEMQSVDVHFYHNPTFENAAGFNPTVLSLKGYFVLLPDVVFEKGNPGISAADCIISATKKIIEMGIVDPKKIALNGHSFGGYETAFIITQTNLFACAIASGGITDLISSYHSIGRGGTPDMWRFDGQYNMGGTPYDIPLNYQANSPIAHIQHVQTPVLLWTGKDDNVVDPHQSMEHYLALRRLGKKSIMLIYPGEGHVLMNPDSQKDLTTRMIEWFDYYLKGDQSAQWIVKGTMDPQTN